MNIFSKKDWIIFCCFFTWISLHATTIPDTYTEPRIEIQSDAISGDCIHVSLESAGPLTRGMVSTRIPGSSRLITVPFSLIVRNELTSSKIPRYVAIIPIPDYAKAGTAMLHISAMANGRSFAAVRHIPISEGNFFTETIALNKKNTEIRTDTSPARLVQIDVLNELLFTTRPDAWVFNGPWEPPVQSTRRTSGFGDRRLWKYSSGESESSTHTGIDFGIPTGTPVFASGDGIVMFADNRISTGLTVVIEHLPGIYSLYYHMDALLASKGEIVRTGSLIGKSGSTGLSTGPHLHWEFRVAGIPVSPDWFTGRILN